MGQIPKFRNPPYLLPLFITHIMGFIVRVNYIVVVVAEPTSPLCDAHNFFLHSLLGRGLASRYQGDTSGKDSHAVSYW